MKRKNFIMNNMVLGLGSLAAPGLLTKQLQSGSRGSDASFEVVIFGGTPSGIVSAVRLAREGHKVLLVSVFEHIGGMLVNGISIMDTMYPGNRSPIYQELWNKISAHYEQAYGKDSEQYKATLFGDPLATGERPRFEAKVVSRIFNEMVEKETNITLWKNMDIDRVEKNGRLIHRISLRSFNDDSVKWIDGRIFMDASYEGDLLAKAKVEHVVGREGRAEFNEQHAGKIFALRAPGAFPYEAAMGLLNLRTFQVVTTQVFAGSTGTGDRAIQAYNARFILTNDPAKRVAITKPANYDRKIYEGITAADKERSVKPYPVKADLLLGSVDAINTGGLKFMNNKFGNNTGNFTGRNWDYPEADWTRRRKMIREHIDHGLGLLYFFQNDETVPDTVRQKSRQYGLSNDEFTDNGFVPYEIYVREARRMRGRYVFTENDGSSADGLDRSAIHDDSIAITEWPMDSHDCTTERKPGSPHDGIILLTEKTRPAQVPYRVLLPKSIDNLLVTVCMSSTHIGWGTLRVEPTFMHIAESAAFASSMALKKKTAPASVNIPELQRLLAEKKIMLSFFNEFDMETNEPWVAAVQWLGTKGFFTAYNARPNEPLTKKEAGNWIMSVEALISGKYDPHSQAEKLFTDEQQDDKTPVATTDFLNMLKKITKKEPAIAATGNTLARKDAALAVYLLLKK